ncbi:MULTISPECIES: amino acid ABC transporter permease [unclassified Chelatococcus]|uniref:amino acid ABC transporter permease n=1 Tax=unclassified Chelatococcus TaxID=2638111 RepID=UPI001BCDAC7C|nr:MULTISPECIES: amino acid ABC transporter permease [unclassified Chelatococcus]MBS7743715.1 amino acid ABC transporter permease [Chelatococcus sp. HY11]MBX3547362.1 amino acid ABC transporter permease [Chelatococcus sp.]CAH1664574.1 Amino acid ABC transporter membrane protein (PAAT family) [Hyphomicrobiales bacterium]CAH1688352.1 Amino acid ABC transporter membrane protein (PAAT family) [Hyphomicrobiales bacterium]
MLEFALKYFPLYFQGAFISVGLTILAMSGALVIGLVVALGRVSGNTAVRYASSAYVALFRGVPPLVMIYIVYFGLPAWAASSGVEWLRAAMHPLDNRVVSATLALSVISGAYAAEILRASIQAVPPEQREAARSIGMSHFLTLRRIILPQAFRIAFPPLGSEFIIILKGTSLVSVIGVSELMRTAQLAASSTFQSLTAYSFAAVFYIAMVILIQTVVYLLERWMRSNRVHA